MCSVMVVCVLVRRIALIAALEGGRGDLAGAPAALAPEPGREQRVGEVSVAAEAFGIRPGMRVGEALARCPDLRLVPADPEGTRGLWASVLDALEGVGAGVESDEPGAAFFDAAGLERMHGGLDGVLAACRRALRTGSVAGSARVGAAPGRFAARAAAERARPRRPVVVQATRVERFLAPLPVATLRTRPGLEELPATLERIGVRTLGELARLPLHAMAERFGHPGLLALELAQGRDTPLQPRRPPEPVRERLDLPEAASGPQLERALELLLQRLLVRGERRGRTLRALVLTARFVGGGTWRAPVALRRPSADLARLRLALAPRLEQLPAPAESLGVEVAAFGPPDGEQARIVHDESELRRERLGEAVRQVRQAAGGEALMRVLEVDPESRLPERRAVLAPYPEVAPSPRGDTGSPRWPAAAPPPGGAP